MTDEDLERELARWMADQAPGTTPASLHQPAHILATRRPSIRPGPGGRALPSLVIAAILIVAGLGGWRAMTTGSPVGVPGASASGPIAVAPTGAASTRPVDPPSPSLAARSDWTAVTWSRSSLAPFAGPGNQFITSVVPLGDGFIAGGYELDGPRTAIVWATADGASWTRTPDPSGTFADSVIDRLAAVPGGVIAIGRPGSPDSAPGVRLWRSSDGRAWARLAVDPATFGDWFDPSVQITAAPDGLIAFAPDRGTGAARIWHSADGAAWSRDPDAEATFDGAALSITATPFGLVATGSRSLGPTTDRGLGPDGVGVAFTSTDGHLWEPAAVDGAHGLGQVYVARDGLLAGGSSHGPTRAIVLPEYWQSADGRHWRPVAEPGPAAMRLGGHVTSDGDRIYALSQASSEWSSDGATWHPLELRILKQGRDEPWAMYQLVAGPGGLVATGETEIGASGEPADQTDAFVWDAVPGARPGAVPMPTAAPQNDHPCQPAEQNPDGTCG